jgi:tetratricopeptide (TPR) repeat protein
MWPFLGLLLQVSVSHQTAVTAYKQHRFPEAVAQFQEALKAEQPGSPDYDESVLLLGQSLYLQSKYQDSIPWLDKAVSGKAPPPEAAYMLGNACILTRQSEKAVAAFARLFQVPADSAAARVTTARMMMHHDLADEAARQAKAALASDPRIPEAHFLLGEVAIFHGDIEGAIAELKAEIAINPSFAMAHYRLGDAYGRTENWDEAMAPLERSVWLNPNFSGPYILLGKGYFKRKEWANAEGVLKHALRLDPQNLSAHYLLGQTLMQEGKSEEANKEFARWKELKGEN